MTVLVLKLIALASMILDHYLKIFNPFAHGYLLTEAQRTLVVTVIEPAGRLAFPIFAYMAAEGAEKTRDIKKYLGRLLIFAFISQPAFAFAFGTGSGLNVMFTIAAAILSIALYETIAARTNRFLGILPFLILMTLAEMHHTDYGGIGVLLIFSIHLAGTKKKKLMVMLIILTFLYLFRVPWNGIRLVWTTSYIFLWVWACLSLVAIACYSGQKKRDWKWLFYIGYPAHLAILAGIKLLAG